MDKSVSVPHLPEKTAAVILGEAYVPALEQTLHRLGIEILPLPMNPFVDVRLSSHADLSVFHSGEDQLYLAPYLKHTEFVEIIQEYGMNSTFLDMIQCKKYPNDAQMNLCPVGEHVIYAPGISDPVLLESQLQQGRRALPCRQGYAKCSVCIVDSKSVITADHRIARICREAGLDVLEITAGGISLTGYSYGFLGGASFKLNHNTLAFTGHLELHPDRDRILRFLSEKEIEAVCLSSRPAFDVGSILPILES